MSVCLKCGVNWVVRGACDCPKPPAPSQGVEAKGPNYDLEAALITTSAGYRAKIRALFDALRAENERLKGVLDATVEHKDGWKARATAAEAELERVRGERDEFERKGMGLCNTLGTTMVELHDTKKERDTARAWAEKLAEALEKIKNGGVPIGVSANVEERMLAMCDIATKALAQPGEGKS